MKKLMILIGLILVMCLLVPGCAPKIAETPADIPEVIRADMSVDEVEVLIGPELELKRIWLVDFDNVGGIISFTPGHATIGEVYYQLWLFYDDSDFAYVVFDVKDRIHKWRVVSTGKLTPEQAWVLLFWE